jgi:hypothetical protein
MNVSVVLSTPEYMLNSWCMLIEVIPQHDTDILNYRKTQYSLKLSDVHGDTVLARCLLGHPRNVRFNCAILQLRYGLRSHMERRLYKDLSNVGRYLH